MTQSVKTQAETSSTMQTILDELRLLRSELSLLLPQDNLEDYTHADRIVNSYKNAVKEHPPMSYGNSQNR